MILNILIFFKNMQVRFFTFLGLFIMFASFVLASAQAQQTSSPAISKIIVKGNQRIETDTVTSFLGINEGDSVDARKIDEALQRVFASELFADVSITVDDNNLIVAVVENPIIGEVAFEGNKRIDNETLSREIQLGPRSVYTKTALQQDVKHILDLYQKSGRFSAKVVPKVIQLEQNRVNLVFEVEEGARTEIAKVAFVGNNAFGDSKLQTVIQTKESVWYRFFSSNDTYDPDRLSFDQELLRRYYISKGYADFRVLSTTAELTQEKDSFVITFTIEEGNMYSFGNMSVENKLSEVSSEELQNLIKTPQGETFNSQLVDETVEEFTKDLGNFGYAFVEVEPQYKRDVEARTIGINYVIKEGPRVYIENINISGNVRTLDEVIRREFRLAEGDPYNTEKLKRSKERIENLGFFKTVNIAKKRASDEDKVDIEVEVEEQSTGELTFGAGFSTTDGALGDISISERNFLGKGQFLKLNFTLSSARQEIDFSFTEPYFMDKNFAAGIDVFQIERNSDSSTSNVTYDNNTTGFVLRGSYPLTEHISHSLRYSFRSDDITDVTTTASLFVKRQEGENTTSLVGHSLIYDTRNSTIDPTEGWTFRLNQDVAGLGGDSKYFRNELRGGYFMPIFKKDVILKVTGKAGNIFGIGEDVRINERFFIGSRDIRGFANEGLGPRDQATGDPLGGNNYAVGTAEVMFPVGLPEELGVKGAVFTDVGTLFGSDDESTGSSIVLDEASPRVSVGAGLSWLSPFGPVRIDVAKALVKENFDKTETIRFNFGTRF